MPETNQKPTLKSRSFIGKHADDLGQLISVQIKPVYQALGIIVPVKSCSLVHCLAQLKEASLVDLAKQLNQSHQLVKQKMPRLSELGLISRNADPDDKRRTLYRLTAKGMEQAAILNKNPMEQIYQQLSEEVAADIQHVLLSAIERLQAKDLLSRFIEHRNCGEQ